MKTTTFAISALVLFAVLAGPAGAQQRGRLEGDVALEKGPLAANDFEKNALAVLAKIIASQGQVISTPIPEGSEPLARGRGVKRRTPRELASPRK